MKQFFFLRIRNVIMTDLVGVLDSSAKARGGYRKPLKSKGLVGHLASQGVPHSNCDP